MTSDLDRLLELDSLAQRNAGIPAQPDEARFRFELALWFRANKSRLKEWERGQRLAIQCSKHLGAPFVVWSTATVGMLPQYCPNCEDEAARKETK